MIRLVEAYGGALRYDPESYSPRDTMRVYSFGWMYWGAPRALLELCTHSLVLLDWSREPERILYRVYSTPGNRCWEDRLGRLPWILGLDEDLSGYRILARGDPLVGGVAEAMPGLRLRASSPWQALLVGVCQQNASFRQGWGMLYRLHLNASERLVTPEGRVYLATPEPHALTPSVLRASGLGYRAETVRRLLEARAHRLDCESLGEAAGVRGVGPYTLALAWVLACRRYSELPLDRWLKRLVAEAYEVLETRAAEELTRRFNGWRGLAALHATIAFDAQPLRRALERLRRGLNRPGIDEPSPLTLWRLTPPR